MRGMVTVTVPAIAGVAAMLTAMAMVFFMGLASKVHEEQDDDQRDRCAQPDQRPGRGAMARVQLQQQQSGKGEDDAGDRENVDQPEPGGAGVAALVQIV